MMKIMMKETELQDSAAAGNAAIEGEALLVKYTSLKDVMLNSPRNNSSEANPAFDSTNISIRNQLVKHAASAYLQSAAVLASRNQNCLVRFWRRLKNNSTLRSCWFVYVRNPLDACLHPVCRFLGWTVHEIGRFWTRRITFAGTGTGTGTGTRRTHSSKRSNL